MLEYIRGKLVQASPLKAVVETGGLGYALHIHLRSYTALPQLGSEVVLYLSSVIREDAHKLYGFLSQEERELFEKLTEISGIGPKIALSLLGHLDPSDLKLAVDAGNAALISKVPGIGKKTAERLIIEMRGRFTTQAAGGGLPSNSSKGKAADAIQALINLGYNPLQAQKNIKTIIEKEEDLSLPDLITTALRTI